MTNQSPRNRTRHRSKRADYEIGKGKPPRHSRFKTGQSGNPKGRPRKPKPGERSLEDFANEIVTVRVKGRDVQFTKGELAELHLVNKAAEGDFRSIIELNRRRSASRENESFEDTSIFDQEAAQHLLNRFTDEIRKDAVKGQDDDSE